MATCKDCIYVDICDYTTGTTDTACGHFKDSSKFVELKHAEWVEDEDMYGDPIYRCSACNERFVLEEGTPTDNGYSYCPNCGAKMDEPALKERESK